MSTQDKGAVLSPCGTYRYHLWRRVAEERPSANPSNAGFDGYLGGRCAFVMLNPSTADANVDDPTIRKCIGYARRWGFEWLDVVNLFAFRATNPERLYDDYGTEPIGPDNDETIDRVCSEAALVVCAWGKHGGFRGRGAKVRADLRKRVRSLCYLKLNGDGSPSHPLYLKGDLTPTEWAR